MSGESLPTRAEAGRLARGLTLSAAALLTGLTLIGLGLRRGEPELPSWDAAAARAAVELRRPELNEAVSRLSWWGRREPLTAVTVAAIGLLWLLGRRRSALLMALIPAGAGLTELIVKAAVARPRPFQFATLGVEPLDAAVRANASFPSGHATGALAVFGTLGWAVAGWLSRPWPMIAGVGVGLFIGATRPYLGVHFVSDVAVGWLAASAWAGLCFWWLTPSDRPSAESTSTGSPTHSASRKEVADMSLPASVMEVYFSPSDVCINKIVDLFNAARQRVDVCVFTITDDRISNAMLAAHRRGVKVRVISDDEKSRDLGSDIEKFVAAGMAVRLDASTAHMHHKFALFDGALLLNGSFNWTRSASRNNQENFVVSNDARLLTAFAGEFEKLWKKFP